MNWDDLQTAVKNAGVVGAGGAGFPTHQKLAKDINTVVINAVECEPLLYTDYILMLQHMDRIIGGAEAFAGAMGAFDVVLGIKHHNALRLQLEDGQMLGQFSRVRVLPDVYPMGDELILIYEALGLVVPPGQLPSSVGVVVINSETAYNIMNGVEGIPLTEKWLTIGGVVENPCVVKVPLNTKVKTLLDSLAVKVPEGHILIDGGPAMGKRIDPDTAIITKTTKGLLVLPEHIPASADKLARPARQIRRTSSACCQCSFCTDMCPRSLLGYPLQPHRTLRAVGADSTQKPEDLITASLCSGCSLCTFVACNQGCMPASVMGNVKKNLAQNRLAYRDNQPTKPKKDRDFRMVPTSRFAGLLGVGRLQKDAPYIETPMLEQQYYTMLLRQHIGKASLPIVKLGEQVVQGQMIGAADEGISTALHAPVAGVVSQITGEGITIDCSQKAAR